jgi:hypothetical protein
MLDKRAARVQAPRPRRGEGEQSATGKGAVVMARIVQLSPAFARAADTQFQYVNGIWNSGALAGGTTAHVSRIELDVRRWHALDRDAQAALLYAPTITARRAEALADDAPSDYHSHEQTVRAHGLVGHAQAAPRARVDNVPVINRRDFATIDDGRPGTHFVALQRDLRDFNNTRAIMNGADGTAYHGSVGARRRNGINAFIDVTHRATFGIPSRALRAYPHQREQLVTALPGASGPPSLDASAAEALREFLAGRRLRSSPAVVNETR